MKYKCKHCDNTTSLDRVVPIVKCTECNEISLYFGRELRKMMQELTDEV